jgi:hypothetical protein
MVTSNRHDRNVQREFERTQAVAKKEPAKEVPTETVKRPTRIKKTA